jgi:hypothetical protein
VGRSEYPDGSCPKSMFIEMEAAGSGIRYRSETSLPDGRFLRSQYTADYNGSPVIVMGTHGMMLPVSLKRVDFRTVVATYKRGFIVVATSRRVVSEDGREMTVTTTSKDASGKTVTTVGVYAKQK